MLVAALACVTAAVLQPACAVADSGADDRAYSVQVLTRISEPVLTSLANASLKKDLPSHDWEKDRANYAPLEAFGRTLSGIAPWLERHGL